MRCPPLFHHPIAVNAGLGAEGNSVLLEFAAENAVQRTWQGGKPPKISKFNCRALHLLYKMADFKTGFMLACATKALYGYGHILIWIPSPGALALLGIAGAFGRRRRAY